MLRFILDLGLPVQGSHPSAGESDGTEKYT